LFSKTHELQLLCSVSGVQYLHFSIAEGDPFAAEWYRRMLMEEEEQKICYMGYMGRRSH
jgi:hypothetical protein